MEKVLAIIKEPCLPPMLMEVEPTLERFYQIINCNWIEAIYPNIPTEGTRIVGYIDDEGKLNGSPLNFRYYDDVVVGTAIFFADDGEGGERSLTGDEIVKVQEYLSENDIMRKEVREWLSQKKNF